MFCNIEIIINCLHFNKVYKLIIHYFRKMVKKLIFSLLVLIFLVQVISAIDTEITIKTLPNHDVNMNFLDPDNGVISFDKFDQNSGASGNLSFVFSSNAPKFDITVFVMKSTEKIVYERFDDNTAGESLYLTLFPQGSEIIRNFEALANQTLEENSTINETVNETINETLEENETETEAKITGSAFFGEKGFFAKNTTYFMGGAVIFLGVGAFVFFKLKKKSKISKEIKLKKLNELQTEEKEKLQDNKEIIEDAEKKIKEAQEDIRKIKNEDKIKEAKKKLIEDEKELVRLREGKE